MGGLYLQYSSRQSVSSKASLNLMLKNFTQQRYDKLEAFGTSQYSGILNHHGKLRSCGINRQNGDNFTFAIYGSCWSDDNDSNLLTPDEILRYIEKNRFSENYNLKGNYIYALYDHRTKELVIENDLFGIFPLYYINMQDGRFFAASEIKSLITLIEPKICIKAVSEMLKYGYVVSDLTFVDGIYRLMPNNRLKILDGKIELNNLKKPEFERNSILDKKDYDDLNEAFLNNIRRYKDSSNNILSISLSGGLDSRIAAFAGKKLGFNLRSWSSGTKGSLECQIAKRVSAQLGIAHHKYEYDGSQYKNWIEKAIWVTEGRCPAGHMHFLEYAINGQLSNDPQLHGLLGDVIIGGDYDNSKIMENDAPIADECARSIKPSIYWPDDCLANLVSDQINDELKSSDRRINEFISKKVLITGKYSDYLWYRFYFRAFGFIIPSLVSQIDPWCDPIFPYLDEKFFKIAAKIQLGEIADRKSQINWAVNYYKGISDLYRVKDGVLIDFSGKDYNEYGSKIKMLIMKNKIKYGICRISRGLVNLPSVETYPYYDQWYRKWPEVRKFVNEILLSERLSERGLFDRKIIKILLKDLSIGKNLWNAVATLLLLEIFFRQFIDQENCA